MKKHMRILAGLLLCAMLIIAMPVQAFAYSYYSNSNITANTAVSAMSYQKFNSSMTLSNAQAFMRHFISNVTTYVKVPNSGSMSRYASDAVYKNTDLGSASKGCYHYADFIEMTMYKTVGNRKYSDEAAGKYTANGVKTFLQKEGQAGEHIRIDGKHSLSFIACTDDGFYTLQWYGDSRQPFLSYYSYSGFAKDLNSIGVRFWIYNADTATNTYQPSTQVPDPAPTAKNWYTSKSNLSSIDVKAMLTSQNFNSSMTYDSATTFINHFISNTSTYVKVPNSGSMSRYASDAVYKNIDLGNASKGCYHYADFIEMTMYKTIGSRKYSSEAVGQYTANGLKAFLEKEGQAGEHIRIDGTHSLAFIVCSGNGFYTLQWYGNSTNPFCSYYLYSDFAKDLNNSGKGFWLYNADTADNTKIPGKINLIYTGTNCSNLPASQSVQKNANGVGEFFLSISKPVYLNYDPSLTYSFKGWQMENINQLFLPGESVRLSTNLGNLYQDTEVKLYPVWQKLKLFNDVPSDHWGYLHIGSLGAQGIVNGYSGTSDFKPNSSINRQEAASIIANGANLTASNYFRTNFSDINKASSWAHTSIYALEQHGVISGFGRTNEFRAKNNIKRNHAAKMIVLAFNLKSGTKAVNLTDIKGVDCEEYIRVLASNGIIGGYEGTSLFKPNEYISRAQFAKMVDLAMQIAGR